MRIRGPLLLTRIHPLGLIRKGYFPNQEFLFLYYFYLPLLNTKVFFCNLYQYRECQIHKDPGLALDSIWKPAYDNIPQRNPSQNLTYSLLFLFIINVVIFPALLYLFGNKLLYSCQVSVRVNFMFYIVKHNISAHIYVMVICPEMEIKTSNICNVRYVFF